MIQKKIALCMSFSFLLFGSLSGESKADLLQEQLKENPYNLTHYADVASAFLEEGNIDAAERTYFKALALNPDFIDVAFGKEILNWTEEEHWFVGKHFFFKPTWKGEDLTGKTIFVYAKKGCGDSLQFCRFLIDLKKRAEKVVFVPQKPLVDLFRFSLGSEIEVIDPDSNLSRIEYDVHASLLALPHLLDLHVKDIKKDSYLSVSSQKIRNAKKIMNPKTFNIGIIWKGDPGHIHDKDRSTPLATFSPLFKLPNVKFYSLQKGPAEKELKGMPHIVNLSPKIRTFADTAAFMKNLDLIITVDTSTSHLAGGLGCPALVLLPKNHDIKWAGKAKDNLWYDSIQAMRQKELGDWEELVERVKVEISNRTR